MLGALVNSGIWAGPAAPDIAALDLLEVAGLELTRTAVNTITIEVGECRDDTDSEDIVVPGTLTFNVANTGANGRNIDTAETASVWYLIYVIKNPTSGAVAAFGINENDVGGFTYPAGYTVKRLLGAIRNDSSADFYECHYYGNGNYRWVEHDEDLWTANILNSGSATIWTNVDASEWIPPISTLGHFHFESEGALVNDFCYFRWDGGTSSPAIAHTYSDADWVQSVFLMKTSDTQIIEYKGDSVGMDNYIFVNGYAYWI